MEDVVEVVGGGFYNRLREARAVLTEVTAGRCMDRDAMSPPPLDSNTSEAGG